VPSAFRLFMLLYKLFFIADFNFVPLLIMVTPQN
jgi:hypothetical protein